VSRFRRAALATFVVQAFNWTGLILSLVTIPLYLEWLGQERYGVLLTGVAFGTYLMFTDFGLSWGAMLLIALASGREDRTEIQSIVRTSLSMAIISATMVLTIGLGWYAVFTEAEFLSSWLPMHPETPGLVLAVGASAVLSLLFSPVYNLFSGLQEAHLTAIYQGSGRLLGAVSALVIAYCGLSLGWVFTGNVAGIMITGVLATIHCVSRHRWAFRLGPFWDSDQLRKQLRTGAKTFGMQVGNVIRGTAPVLAISSVAGAQFVPFFSIPMSLLNAPLGVLNSLSSCMQAGYGEAMGSGDQPWISHTVHRIVQQLFTILGLLGCGFLLLAGPFVELWTGGKIELERSMLLSVLVIGSASAITSVFRFALTGINRHRRAAVYELLCGGLTIVLSVLFVRYSGYQSIGIAIAIATGLTSGWLLPRELRLALGRADGFWPSESFLARWAVTVGCTYVAGWAALEAAISLSPLVAVLLAGTTCVVVFLMFSAVLLQPQVVGLRQVLRLATGRGT
jgi:O-antigen/teichoic acid export membrane protein